MQKEIEKAVLKITQAMEKNRKEFVEVEGNYRDTGYDRYWNKMQKLDAEYEELRAFIQPKQELSQIKEMDELQRVVKNIKSKWEHLKSDIPITADSIGIDDLFRELRI
jgi:predicted nuclease with TOPRIM domain